MNTMRRFCAATLLAMMLTLTPLAGELPTGVTQPPPPGEPATIQEDGTTSLDGEMGTPRSADSTLEAALSLLRVVLSIM